MTRDSSNAFFRNLRTALGNSPDMRRNWADLVPETGASARQDIQDEVRNRSGKERMDLLARLVEAAATANLQVSAQVDAEAVTKAIARLVRDGVPEWGKQKSVIAWKHDLIDSLGLADALAEFNVPVYCSDLDDDMDRDLLRERTINSFMGVTSADYCIADSATLVLKTRKGQARSVSLVPSTHIAVIELRHVLANLKELYALLAEEIRQHGEGLTNCMTFISGPSKTADIEGSLVQGAHGPRQMHLFVITGP